MILFFLFYFVVHLSSLVVGVVEAVVVAVAGVEVTVIMFVYENEFGTIEDICGVKVLEISFQRRAASAVIVEVIVSPRYFTLFCIYF